jgi:hypothetical protein
MESEESMGTYQPTARDLAAAQLHHELTEPEAAGFQAEGRSENQYLRALSWLKAHHWVYASTGRWEYQMPMFPDSDERNLG